MALIPDRSTLESLRRADLQKLCKDHGLKANMKSDQLIDMLLDTAQANPSTRMPRRAGSVRIASESSTGRDTKGRVGSMIIHDLSEDEGDDGQQGPAAESSTQANGGPSQAQPKGPSPPSGPATRTRKAKETLYKLGVGRPKALGGTGARKVSSGPPSGFGARGRRVKASVSMQPSHESIREEEEDGASHMSPVDEPMPEAGPSGTTHDAPSSLPTPTMEQQHDNAAHLQTMIAEAVDPLRTELEKLRSELQRWTSLHGDVDSLHTTVSHLTSEIAALRLQSTGVDEMQQKMKSLEEEIAVLRASRADNDIHMRTESSGKATEQSVSNTAVELPSTEDASPSPPKTSLGKRHRDSPDTNSGVIDPSQASALTEEELEKKVVRPGRKRPKLAERESSGEASRTPEVVVPNHELIEDEDMPEIPPAPRAPSFTIFSGPEEPPDNGPPTTRLSDVFGHTAVTPPHGLSTATASASENQPPSTGGPFNFNFAMSIFQPATSTPTGTPGASQDQGFPTLPNMPALEPPTSPTPAGPPSRLSVAPGTRPPRPPSAAGRPASRNGSRQSSAGSSRPADGAGQTPGLPTIGESSAQAQGRAPTNTNPAHRGMGMSMGLPGYVPLPVAPDTPAPPMKRTLYGTELDGDTRFGDFGVEGVATGFWTGAAPRY